MKDYKNCIYRKLAKMEPEENELFKETPLQILEWKRRKRMKILFILLGFILFVSGIILVLLLVILLSLSFTYSLSVPKELASLCLKS